MQSSEKNELFSEYEISNKLQDTKEWGTFKDSLKAPVHKWFTYPAGFSFKAVEYSLDRFDIKKGMTVYDPFMGSGTTNLVAKSKAINSVGIEAHPFVHRITNAKLNWNIDSEELSLFCSFLEESFGDEFQELFVRKRTELEDVFPELVLKCYNETTLKKLYVIRTLFENYDFQDQGVKEVVFVALTALLRGISSAATGWPYIAPKKLKVSSNDKDALEELLKVIKEMNCDLADIENNADQDWKSTNHQLILGSSTDVSKEVESESVDHIFSSPPYLNNFDYSDRTRLELYFWGIAKTWGDISRDVRTKLMTSATTQIKRTDPKYVLDESFKQDAPKVAEFITIAVSELSELRKVKGGKKSYDLMVLGYFNDIYKILKESYRVLKPGTRALFVLGDSAPYGVHIPTDVLIGEIGRSVGFDRFSIEVLRKRGEKWKSNPQRHGVALRESIVILEKD